MGRRRIEPRDAAHARRLEIGRRWAERNREATRQKARDWLARNPDYQLMRRYGITRADYDRMVIEQGGRCACCLQATERLVVDHCHETDFVRGLLCDKCNSVLGYMQDNVNRISLAKHYLAERRDAIERAIEGGHDEWTRARPTFGRTDICSVRRIPRDAARQSRAA